jgi:hypothetical protein
MIISFENVNALVDIGGVLVYEQFRFSMKLGFEAKTDIATKARIEFTQTRREDVTEEVSTGG